MSRCRQKSPSSWIRISRGSSRPTQSWKQAFSQAVRRAARELGIRISAVHRLRTNYAQRVHKDLLDNGKSDQEARREVSCRLGNNLVEVANSYIPLS